VATEDLRPRLRFAPLCAKHSLEIERALDAGLPETYERALFKQKCDNRFDVALGYASRGRKWAA
jgi:hypothetical protein